MAVADSGAARAGRGAAPGSAGRGAAGLAKGGVIARAALLALGRQPVWWCGCGACRGTGDLVGAAIGLVGQDSWNDEATAARILLVCGAAKLRCDALRD